MDDPHAVEPRPEGETQGGAPLTAYDSATARELLKNLTDEQLKQIPVLPPGSLVERDETCLDLADPEVREFVVAPGAIVAENALLVPRSKVGDRIWSRLRGEPDPEPREDEVREEVA